MAVDFPILIERGFISTEAKRVGEKHECCPLVAALLSEE